MTEPVLPTHPEEDGRLVGWKAIASRLHVCDRTAQRWAERFNLPVHRYVRGGRPLVFALAEELDAWYQSIEAARARGDKGDPAPGDEPDGGCTEAGGTTHAVAEDLPSAPSPGVPSDAPASNGRHRRTIVVGLMGAAILVTCAALVWLGAISSTDRGLAEREAARAHGEALSLRRIQVGVRVEGRPPSTVTIRPGDLARIEVPDLRLGIQFRTEGTRLRMIVHRLRGLPEGESAEYLLTRVLVDGQPEHVTVDGVAMEITWRGSFAPSDSGGSAEPLKPCCVACEGVSVCGEAVTSACGRCGAKPAAPASR